MRIDAHQHFWIYNAERDQWITDAMRAIQRDFLPNDLAPSLRENGIDGVVAVQASQSHEETQFLVDLSTVYAMIKAVVGWVDLASEKVDEYLEHFSQFKVIKGFRHVVEAEEETDFLMRDDIQRGIKALKNYGYTYDLLVRPRHFESTLACVRKNPEQQFVLDHMAKPSIKTGEFDQWAAFIEQLASNDNVVCKVSGLATEAGWQNWKIEDFALYIDHVVTCFGVERILYGSDWPVCLLAATYKENMEIMSSRLSSFTEEEKAAFWGGNALRIYHI